MADTLTPSERSERMSRVRNKDSRAEMTVRRVAHSLGYRYRLHSTAVVGHPDLVFPRLRSVVFVHGCFWHRHPGCPRTRTPKSRVEFWTRKFERNVARDKEVKQALRKAGWRVLTIWECEAEASEDLKARLAAFLGEAK